MKRQKMQKMMMAMLAGVMVISMLLPILAQIFI